MSCGSWLGEDRTTHPGSFGAEACGSSFISGSVQLHTMGTPQGQNGPLWRRDPESKEHSFRLGWDWGPAGEGPTTRGIAIKGEQESCFVHRLCLAPSELKVAGHFPSLAALELCACQLSQLNPITASSISFGPTEHSLITSPKISIIRTKAPYPKDFSGFLMGDGV